MEGRVRQAIASEVETFKTQEVSKTNGNENGRNKKPVEDVQESTESDAKCE